MSVKKIPQGYQALCPYVTVPNAARVITFLQAAFGAEVRGRSDNDAGQVLNSELRIGNSMMMVSDCRDHLARPTTIYMYVEDCDAVYARAVAAGAVSIMPPTDMFYGDRHGGVTDPGGNQWWVATRIEDVSADEVSRRAAAFYGKK